MTLAEHLRDFIHNVRIGFARWKVARELRKKRPDFLTKASCGDLELLWEHIDGMPTGRTVFFPPSGVAGIVAGMDDKFGRDDTPDRLLPPIANRWKDEETPVTPETIRAANLQGIVALGFFKKGRIIDNPSIHDYVMMTYNDETGEGENGLDRWAELRRRYSKETFWVPRKDRR